MLSELLEICNKYAGLKYMMQKQLNDILENDDLEKLIEEGKVKKNSLKYIQSFLESVENFYNDMGINDGNEVYNVLAKIKIEKFFNKENDKLIGKNTWQACRMGVYYKRYAIKI